MPTASRPSSFLAAILLATVALAHLARVFLGLEVVIGGRTVSMAVSVVATIVAGGLSIGLWRESRG